MFLRKIILKIDKILYTKRSYPKVPGRERQFNSRFIPHLPSSSHASTRDLNMPSAESSDDGVSNSAALPSSITSTKSLSMIVLSR